MSRVILCHSSREYLTRYSALEAFHFSVTPIHATRSKAGNLVISTLAPCIHGYKILSNASQESAIILHHSIHG